MGGGPSRCTAPLSPKNKGVPTLLPEELDAVTHSEPESCSLGDDWEPAVQVSLKLVTELPAGKLTFAPRPLQRLSIHVACFVTCTHFRLINGNVCKRVGPCRDCRGELWELAEPECWRRVGASVVTSVTFLS